MATESARNNREQIDSRIADDDVAPALAESLEAFRRDLPQLLKTHRGQWVTHHGSQQIGIARTAAALYEECSLRSLKWNEFLVSHISPEIPDDDITWSVDT